METRRVSFAAQNEIDAEQAFLNSMKALQELDEAGTPITVTITEDAAKVETEQTNGDKDESDSDSGDSSAHEDTQNEEQITPDSGDAGVQSNIAPTTSASTKSRSSSPVKPDVQEVQETTAAPASSPPASASQPRRTTLPFSYEEDSEPTAPSGNVTGAPSSTSDNTNGHRHVSPSPSITSSINVTPSATSHVPEQSAVNSANNTPPPLSMIASTKPTGVISNSSSVISPGVTHKRKRLPQDRVGQLEDRIAEDSRGDVDAWLNLIAEHQKKGKSDEARAVFERFFTVFPACVSEDPFH